jgi:hypothetical protein
MECRAYAVCDAAVSHLPLVRRTSELGTRPDQLESIGGPTGVTVPQPLLATWAVESDPVVHNRFVDGVRNPDLAISALVDRGYDLQGLHARCCVSPVDRRAKHRCSIARLRQNGHPSWPCVSWSIPSYRHDGRPAPAPGRSAADQCVDVSSSCVAVGRGAPWPHRTAGRGLGGSTGTRCGVPRCRPSPSADSPTRTRTGGSVALRDQQTG